MSEITSTTQYLEAGLKAVGVRQKAIANNIANLETDGYRSIDVKFEELLNKAMKSNGGVDIRSIEPEFFEPGTSSVKENGNDVNLEEQIGKLVQNSLKHRTYIRLLDKKYKQMQSAIEVK